MVHYVRATPHLKGDSFQTLFILPSEIKEAVIIDSTIMSQSIPMKKG